MKPSERADKLGKEYELKSLRDFPDTKYDVRLSAVIKLKGQVKAILEYLDERHKE